VKGVTVEEVAIAIGGLMLLYWVLFEAVTR
jgi:hypothetical protein